MSISEKIRKFFYDQKIEKERKRILRIRQMKVRDRPFSDRENEEEMKKFIMSGTYQDSDGRRRKIKSLSRDITTYYRQG